MDGNPHLISAGDGSVSAYDRIRKGEYQIGTVPEPLNLHGWQAMDELNRAFAGEKPSGYVTKVHLVTKNNIDADGRAKSSFDPDNGYRDPIQKDLGCRIARSPKWLATSRPHSPSSDIGSAMDNPNVFKLGASPLHRVRPDLLGTVFEGQDVTLVRWDIPHDRPVTPLHSHADHEQFTIVVSGAIETTIGDEVLTLRAGDMCRIERNVPHGATRALDGADAILIDVFSPPRADYVAASRQGAPA